MLKTIYLAALCVAPLCGAAAAQGAVDLTVVASGVRAQAFTSSGTPTSFSSSFTGDLLLSIDSNSVFADVRIDDEPVAVAGSLSGVVAQITFAAGVITGGSVVVDASEAGQASRFSGAIQSGLLPAITGSQNFSFVGDFATVDFDASTFAGIPVAPWRAAGDVTGAFYLTGLSPDASGLDENVDLTIYLLADDSLSVPEPTAFLFAGLGAWFVLPRRVRGTKPVV